ncbi:MAG TPA: DUF929 family protein [Trebonia sp.]|jgi:hypothetical protein|nr:DUF929 family protein [Trebonia sp.]
MTSGGSGDPENESRTRLVMAGSAIIVIIVVVLGFAIYKVTVGKASPTAAASAAASSDASGNAPGTGSASLQALVSQVTGVPAAALNQVGPGSVQAPPVKISGDPLTSGGKPEVLFVGAEFCPYCAAQRWGMIVALSRFGTFTGLATTHSAVEDGGGNTEPYPNTRTWTFVNARFSSKYLTFTPVETNTNIPDTATGGYTELQSLTKDQKAIVAKYDAPPYIPSANAGAIPFIDFGNRWMIVGASYSPAVLQGLTWAQIAADLSHPSSAVAQGVLGTANVITASICSTTGNQPASACTSAIRGLEKQL